MRPRDATKINWVQGEHVWQEPDGRCSVWDVTFLFIGEESRPRGFIHKRGELWEGWKYHEARPAADPEYADAAGKLALAKLRLANACEAIKEQ